MNIFQIVTLRVHLKYENKQDIRYNLQNILLHVTFEYMLDSIMIKLTKEFIGKQLY